jgi:hypothetical protein
MTSAPKRRWFSFSLRTLFVVVTVFGCWLGWNVNAVQKRTHLIDNWAAVRGVRFKRDSTWDPPPVFMNAESLAWNFAPSGATYRTHRAKGVGWVRRMLLGDQPIDSIWIPGVWRNDTEVSQIDKAFPEATIIIGADR